MKIIEKLKNKHVEMFLLLIGIYFIGAIADGFGFLNWVINMIGIILQLAILPFILYNLIYLFDSGLLPSRKSAIINLVVIFVLLTFIGLCWKLKMAAFAVTSFIIVLVNLVMLILSVYRLTRVYMEVIIEEKEENNINNPRASIIKFFKNFQ